MQENKNQKRINLIIELLLNLKATCKIIQNFSANIEQCSDNFLEELYIKNKIEITNDINKYNSNIEKIKNLNSEVTLKISSWYSFVNSIENTNKALYPIRFYSQKSKLKDFINKANDEISKTIIENRFIQEKLTVWEKELKLKAITEIKTENSFSELENSIRKKEELLNELKYLISTIPGICPIEIDLDNIDYLIEKLSKTAVA